MEFIKKHKWLFDNKWIQKVNLSVLGNVVQNRIIQFDFTFAFVALKITQANIMYLAVKVWVGMKFRI